MCLLRKTTNMKQHKNDKTLINLCQSVPGNLPLRKKNQLRNMIGKRINACIAKKDNTAQPNFN
jgi:hypothetical protein